jgi:hypothetical protein
MRIGGLPDLAPSHRYGHRTPVRPPNGTTPMTDVENDEAFNALVCGAH